MRNLNINYLIIQAHRFKEVVGILAILAGGIGELILGRYGLFGGKLLSELFVFFALMLVYPEDSKKIRFFEFLFLSSLGVIVSSVWVIFYGISLLGNVDLQTFNQGYIHFFVWAIGIVIITPLFEEKIIRGLIFSGLNERIGFISSSLISSLIFAVAHTGAMVWAFFVSFVLCLMMIYFKLDTCRLAIIHGSINFVVLGWLFYSSA